MKSYCLITHPVLKNIENKRSKLMINDFMNIALDETNYETFDTIDGGVVMAVELHKGLDEAESKVVAERLANKLFDLGHTNFDIEISV